MDYYYVLGMEKHTDSKDYAFHWLLNSQNETKVEVKQYFDNDKQNSYLIESYVKISNKIYKNIITDKQTITIELNPYDMTYFNLKNHVSYLNIYNEKNTNQLICIENPITPTTPPTSKIYNSNKIYSSNNNNEKKSEKSENLEPKKVVLSDIMKETELLQKQMLESVLPLSQEIKEEKEEKEKGTKSTKIDSNKNEQVTQAKSENIVLEDTCDDVEIYLNSILETQSRLKEETKLIEDKFLDLDCEHRFNIRQEKKQLEKQKQDYNIFVSDVSTYNLIMKDYEEKNNIRKKKDLEKIYIEDIIPPIFELKFYIIDFLKQLGYFDDEEQDKYSKELFEVYSILYKFQTEDNVDIPEELNDVISEFIEFIPDKSLGVPSDLFADIDSDKEIELFGEDCANASDVDSDESDD